MFHGHVALARAVVSDQHGAQTHTDALAAQALEEFVIVDMFADVAVNNVAPKDAIRKAESRLMTIYKRA